MQIYQQKPRITKPKPNTKPVSAETFRYTGDKAVWLLLHKPALMNRGLRFEQFLPITDSNLLK
jgi:hypothetical protein